MNVWYARRNAATKAYQMHDSYLLELLSWAHSLSSLSIGAPRGAPKIDRLDVIAAIGASRSTLTLQSGEQVADVTDIGPELIQLEAGVPIKVSALFGPLARATVAQLLSEGKKPNAKACHEAAKYSLWIWLNPGRRTSKPMRIEDCRERAEVAMASMMQHVDACIAARMELRDTAMRRFSRQISAARNLVC